MKLITEERFDDLEYIIEDSGKGTPKQMYIEGIFMQTNKKNRNGRIYEDKIIRPVVDKYITEQVKEGRALGELNHPSTATINLDRVSHRITELKWDNDDIYGKALVLNTPTGSIVKGLIEGGSRLGVSSRGMGSIEKRKIGNESVSYVKNDFMLATVDVVADPSAHDAFVNGILEGVEFIFDPSGNLIQKRAEEFFESKKKRINETKALNELEKLLNNL